MRLLDLYCGAGGASMGYHLAGFEVIGVDIEPQPTYPFEFHQAHALASGVWWHDIDAVHASPPCQAYSRARVLRDREHDGLIAATRRHLDASGLPYVIENVVGARRELHDPQLLCGTMFGLLIYRHRLFETNWHYTPPLHGGHYLRQVKMGRPPGKDQILFPVGNFSGVERARQAMGMPWANRDGLREAVPPAYTEHIGCHLMRELTPTIDDAQLSIEDVLAEIEA